MSRHSFCVIDKKHTTDMISYQEIESQTSRLLNKLLERQWHAIVPINTDGYKKPLYTTKKNKIRMFLI